MKILLTGGTGFLGSHVCHQLLKSGHDVTVCFRSTSSLGRLERLTSGLLLKPILVNYEDLNLSLGYDVLIHMATQYGRGQQAFSEIIDSNVLFPARLLEECLINGIQTFVNTDSYYSIAGYAHPLANYILTKKYFSEWARCIAGQRIKLVNMCIEHLYGPMDSPDKFCTYIVRECLLNNPNILLTECDQLRDFIYVEDVALAYVTLIQHINDCKLGWNEIGVGTGKSIQLKEFVSLAHSLTNSHSNLCFGAIAKSSAEIRESKADNTFLTQRGWSDLIDLRQGILNMIEEQYQSIFTKAIHGDQ